VIKAKLNRKDMPPLLIFGLSYANVERMQKGEPIYFSLTELGVQPPIDIMIMSGKTEEGMQAQLSEFVDMPPW
jgi:hypothetical protein